MTDSVATEPCPSVCGFLLIDKARGDSSHRALSPFKRRFKEKRAGHAGTLDPLATGLLFAAIGKATRLLPLAEGADKEYLVALRLGVRTDTLDMDGTVLSTDAIPDTAALDWNLLVAPWIGEIDQVPPAYSAISVDGVRSYERARKGEVVDLPSRRVRIDSVEPVIGDSPLSDGWQPGDITLRVRCSKGTYVRSLVRDLGEAIGCGATVSALRRTAIGPWRVPDTRPVDGPEPGLVSVGEAFPKLPRFVLDPSDAAAASHGHAVSCGLDPVEDALMLREDGIVLAWGRVRDGRFQPKAMLV
ncbi:MAG: tRNA pseudouridine(55) synthase TruB [Fibrobacteria bacterium]|nr:tRNA pseudouridine(55) synthase TruB [Fibrobacteria bacterium]